MYILINFGKTYQIDDYKSDVKLYQSKPLIAIGLTMFPIYQIQSDKESNYIKHLVIQNVNPFAYYLSFFVAQGIEIVSSLVILIVLSPLKGINVNEFFVKLLCCILDIFIILVASLLFSGFIYSKSHHSPLAYFVSAFLLMILVDPLCIIQMSSMPQD